ncbi:chemotaxis-specific protein-glutamate methyltransferase CheB [Magnetococcales bacterium HHB-1]
MANRLKVMVVDDTITYRMIMKKVAESIAGIEVISSASNGKIALAKLEDNPPDVILLDVEMPVMNGLETLQRINKTHPDIDVVMVSGLSRSNANIVMECLTAGALDFVTKPLEDNAEKAKEAIRGTLSPILNTIVRKKKRSAPVQRQIEARPFQGGVKKVGQEDKQRAVAPAKIGFSHGASARRLPPVKRTQRPMTSTPPVRRPLTSERGPGGVTKSALAVQKKSAVALPARRPVVPKRKNPQAPELLLIGSSTGGPAALSKVLTGLNQQILPIPTLIVQHMPPVFTASLAEQLTRSSGLTVNEAAEGIEVTPGSITLAKGGAHMVMSKKQGRLWLNLNNGPKVNECRPAVDVLFMSAMACFTGKILAVILTGMGRDGTNGVDALKRRGNTYCLTQDQNSCVVYGMPRSVVEKGLSDEALPLTKISGRILEICT